MFSVNGIQSVRRSAVPKNKRVKKSEKQEQIEFELDSFDLMLKRMVKRGVIV